MINMNEIHEEIAKLESCEHTTYDLCKKLAILYIVRDHYKPRSGGEGYSAQPTSMSTPSAQSASMPVIPPISK